MQLIGRAYIAANGERLRTEKGSTLAVGGVNRESINGDNGTEGFAANPVPAKLECSISVGPGESVTRFRDFSDATITFECDTGQVYVMRNAWLTEPPTVTGEQGGKVKLMFEGPPAEEQI